ncbi:MAG: alpha/beta fold hydrolase [Myxococcales bacterium]|nr:alpha/beta fold hydrolase [Myxococcales bacterium]
MSRFALPLFAFLGLAQCRAPVSTASHEPVVQAPAAPSSLPPTPDAGLAVSGADGREATRTDGGSVVADFGQDPTISLAVPKFAHAFVHVPLGRTTPAPIVVAAHGNYDRPEWQCGEWGHLFGTRAFVLCPRGVARSDSPSKDDVRFTYDNASRFSAEVDAAVLALRERFGALVDPGPMAYVGFSLGALFGVTYALRESSPVARMVLIEGGHSSWSADLAKRFARKGGKRVLFACGQSACTGDAKRAGALLAAANVAVFVAPSTGEGHTYGGLVAAQVAQRLDWLLEGDARFAK